jgi:acyl-CoA thioester hydrolase
MTSSNGGAAPKPAPETRSAFFALTEITTRWTDNDVYGHINNIVYYSYFDTAINRFLIENKCLELTGGKVVGFVVETGCRYFRPLAFPQRVYAGIRVARLGRSSVRYEVGIFGNEEDKASAQGHFVHVYVDRETTRPVTSLPGPLREALQPLLFGGSAPRR